MPFITESELKDRLNSSQNLLRNKSLPEKEEVVEQEKNDAPEQNDSMTLSGKESQLSVQEHHFRGRTNGTKNIPSILHSIIGISSQLSGPLKTSESFGIAPSTAHGYGQGFIGGTSPSNIRDPELVKEIEKDLDKAKGKAIDAMLTSLGLLDRESMRSAKAKDLASIAKDMASIVEKVSPKVQNQGTGVKITILTPPVRTELQYEEIRVG